MNSFEDDLHAFQSPALRRHLRTVESEAGVKVVIDGKSLINFSSNDYVHLAHHPRLKDAAKRAIDQWGTSATSSRLLSGSTALHRDLEKALATFMDQDAALVFPSGYSTNTGLIPMLVGAGDAVILDRLCHASLVDGARLSGARLLVYTHGDVEAAEKALQRAQSSRRRLLVTESVFSMDGDIAPLKKLAELLPNYNAMGYLDEAHAVGVLGFHGRGVLGLEGMDDPWDVIVGTLSKALGSQGGFVAGSQALIDLIVNRARSFIFTTGLAPANAAAALAALRLVQEDPSPRVFVQKLANQLREGLRLQGWLVRHSSTQIIPIVLGSAERAIACAEHLRAHGIFAPAIRPPTVPADECRLRFSLTAGHSESDIAHVLEVLSRFPTA